MRKYKIGQRVRYNGAAIRKYESAGFVVTREIGTVARIARYSARLEQYAIRFDDRPDRYAWLYASDIEPVSR